MEVITSLENKQIKYFNKLKEKKFRDEENLFLVETDHLIEEAYKCGLLKWVIREENTSCNIEIEQIVVTSQVFKKISTLESSRGLIGVVRKFKPKVYGSRLLVLDGIQDPGNLGTILRSALGFNMDTVILGSNCVDLYNEKVVRATEGAIFHINVLRVELKSFLEELKKNHYTIYGTNVENGTILDKVQFNDKCAMIIGNEGRGISEEISSFVDQNLYIPMNPRLESLNASVAASILMYEMSKNDYE